MIQEAVELLVEGTLQAGGEKALGLDRLESAQRRNKAWRRARWGLGAALFLILLLWWIFA